MVNATSKLSSLSESFIQSPSILLVAKSRPYNGEDRLYRLEWGRKRGESLINVLPQYTGLFMRWSKNVVNATASILPVARIRGVNFAMDDVLCSLMVHTYIEQ